MGRFRWKIKLADSEMLKISNFFYKVLNKFPPSFPLISQPLPFQFPLEEARFGGWGWTSIQGPTWARRKPSQGDLTLGNALTTDSWWGAVNHPTELMGTWRILQQAEQEERGDESLRAPRTD